MPDSPLDTLLVGSFLTIGGLWLLIFHKEIRNRIENWNERVPWFLQSGPPRGGRMLTVEIIVFGALLVYIGVAQVVRSFVQQ
jgi:hypothetical protein